MNTRFDPAYGAFVLRVALGVLFVAHAALKIFVFTIPGTVGFFASLGLPAIAAYGTIAAELLGGVALILGLWVRPVAAVLVPVALGATWAHAGNGWLFTAPNGGWEFPALIAAATIAQVFLGAGAFALKGEDRAVYAALPAE
ncbi:DoxX family protein [Prosthecomicrobium sp. N25]|uniref:DoxX family protein n=1 Tax=Prosthecomicrobium sp. N25 TaxID=3129254 RepID=UPI00307695F5